MRAQWQHIRRMMWPTTGGVPKLSRRERHASAGWAQRATVVLVEDTEGVREFLRTLLGT
jgi:hypothetical protein